ncbi:uncharacterized protein LOC135628155 isoform X2 [Musa acuminata AAA Group]|uniref:uncharacterized protein LOC135628155 isoform X2 n=1 Tax=Musa acuminata AAA Group TaxID=214697 RepID=UPI0031CFFE40
MIVFHSGNILLSSMLSLRFSDNYNVIVIFFMLAKAAIYALDHYHHGYIQLLLILQLNFRRTSWCYSSTFEEKSISCCLLMVDHVSYVG